MGTKMKESNQPVVCGKLVGATVPPCSPFMKKYDHEEVRCEAMADADCDTKLVGEKATCCVCIGHDCKEAQDERAKNNTKYENPLRN